MGLIERVCKRVASWCQLRAITREDGAPYLDRYYLFGNVPKYFPDEIRPRLAWLPWTFFLHHFRDSDRDVELHNHPWKTSVSLVIAGGYVEERRHAVDRGISHWNPEHIVKSRTVKPGRINVIRATDYHRVTLLGKDAWTIFVTGRKGGTWFFWHPRTRETIPWREHLERREAMARCSAPGGKA